MTIHHGRIHGPDVLRGLAALGVIVFHVLYLSGIPVDQTAAAIAGRMDFFVRVFFVLSAFAIGHAYYDRMGDVGAVRAFYLKRFFRIAPLFYFMMLVGVLFRVAMEQPMPPLMAFILSGSFLFTLVPGQQGGLVGGGWSIGIEWMFYFLFPMLLALVRSVKAAATGWLLLCTVAVLTRAYLQSSYEGQLNEFGSLNFLAHGQYFMLGLMIMHLHRRWKIQADASVQRHVVGTTFIVVLASTLYALRTPSGLPEELLLSLATPLMVALSIVGFPSWLDNRVTRWLGLISYSTYLVQFPIIQLLQMHGIYAWINGAIKRDDLAFMIASALTLACVILVAALTYRFVEVPGQRLYARLRRDSLPAN